MSEGALPETVEALTGVYSMRGRAVRGRHKFYLCDESEQLVGNLGKDFKGIDIKHNGYVLINPSNHGSGVQYDWVPGHAPWEMEIAEAPEELLALLRKRGRRFPRKGATGARTPSGVEGFDDQQWAATWEELKSSVRTATPYAAKVLASECTRIKKLVHGDERNNELNNAAMRMGHLIGGRQISLRECRVALADAGRTSYRKSPGGPGVGEELEAAIEKVLRVDRGGFEDGARDPEYPVDVSLVQFAELATRRVKDPVFTEHAEILEAMRMGFFTGRGDLLQESLIAGVKKFGPLATDPAGRIRMYERGAWRVGGEDEIRRRTRFLLGEMQRTTHSESVIYNIAAERPLITGLGPAEYINCVNGMLEWATGTLTPHDPKYYSTYQLVLNWRPEATCPTVEAWLAEVLPVESHELFWEVLGVTIYAGMGFHKAVLLVGPGRNGKGTFLRLILAVIPAEFVSSVDMQSLGSNRFAPAELFGKVANISGDLAASALETSSPFKQLTGGDKVYAEFKNKQPFSFFSQATLLFAANEIPATRDHTLGYYSRLVLVPFTQRRLSDEEIDPTLEPRMHRELEGVLVQAVAGLRRAMARGRFDEPPAVRALLDAYRLDSDPLAGYVDEHAWLTGVASDWVSRKEVYGQYVIFCRENGHKPLGHAKFKSGLIGMGNGKITDAKRGNERGYRGLALIPGNKLHPWLFSDAV
jgi:P4 family phage/plasmid primase-like protien